MLFVSTFLTAALKMAVLAVVIIGGIRIGKKIRDNKDAKDAAQQ